MARSTFYESQLEELVLDELESLGYQVNLDDVSNHPRDSYSKVLLDDVLFSALETINRTMPPQAIEEAFRLLHVRSYEFIREEPIVPRLFSQWN
jgi:type I site-specific restriction-modification system R (restriction) subunit